MILTHTKPGNHSSRLLATLSHQGTLVFTDDSSSSFFYFLRKYLYICVCVLSCFSHIRLFATLRTGACQAPLSMGFSRQEYWIGLSCPTPGDLPDPGIEPMSLTSPTLVGRFFTTSAAWEIPSLFIFGCAGSSLLCGLSLAMVSGDHSLVVVHSVLFVVASLVSERRF